MKKALTSLAVAFVIIFSYVPEASAAQTRNNFYIRYPDCYFSDIPQDHWSINDVHNAYWRGVIKGVDQYTFNPSGNATMLSLLETAVRASDIYYGGEGYLPTEYGYRLLYNTAAERGIISGVEGYGDSSNLDTRPATRKQMAQLFMNIMPAYEYNDINNKGYAPTDITDSDVLKMYTAGILQGSNGKMNENSYVTNAEAAVAISRVITWRVEWKIPDDFRAVLGEYTTKYDANVYGRSHNIALAASAINDTVLEPGASFSFNGVVGSRNTSRGYMAAPVLVGGKYESGIGGGVCQVSTTVFNAALLSNMEITERFPHALAAGYVPLGMDAAVYYGLQDFRFRNPYSTPVTIKAHAENGELTVKILGHISCVPSSLSLNVTREGRYYVLKRTVDGYINYTVKTKYN